MNNDRWDYVVIGAGAAGCAVAARLSENAGNRVVLIEGGSRPRNPLLHIPALSVLAMMLPRYNYKFETEPVPEMHNRRLIWAQGRGLGGGSAINGMIYTRGHSSEYDQWQQMGCTGWGFDGVLPYFKRAKTNARGPGPWHGGSGPIDVKPSGARLPVSDAFIAAVADYGIPFQDDLNCDATDAIGYHDINVARGRRISTAVGYLGAARHRRNLKVLTETRALRIRIEKGRATGVEIEHDGLRRTVWADREIVVSAGAVQTPQLLMLSGVGPADRLRALGIEVAVAAPEVGSNLSNHPNFLMHYTCSEPVSAYKYLSPGRAVGSALACIAGRGPFSDSWFAAGGHFRSDPALATPDAYVIMGVAMVRPDSLQAGWRDLLPKEHGFSISVALGRPKSTGSIALRSSNPLDRPVIRPNYFSEPTDLPTLSRTIGMVREMMQHAPIRSLIDQELTPGPAVIGDAAIQEAIRARGWTSYHPMGTCRMGSDPASVVDPELRVRGVDALRVADASIMPTALNACTHAPSIMIGEKAADMISGQAERLS